MLRDTDVRHLVKSGYRVETYPDGGMTLLVIDGYQLPGGYRPETADLLIQIPRDYPDANLDMWWMFPPVVFARTGAEPINCTVRQAFPGFTPDPQRQWQRFSRHPSWRAGIDDLRTFLVSLHSTMENEVQQVAA